MSEAIMKKRQAAIDEAYEAQWDAGRGSHHPDYDPEATGAVKATRETEELLNAIIKARSRCAPLPPAVAEGVRLGAPSHARRSSLTRLTPPPSVHSAPLRAPVTGQPAPCACRPE